MGAYGGKWPTLGVFLALQKVIFETGFITPWFKLGWLAKGPPGSTYLHPPLSLHSAVITDTDVHFHDWLFHVY